MRRYLIMASMAATTPLLLAAAPAEMAQPAEFKALIHCRSIGDATARLACFDQAAAQLETAAGKRDVVVVDRAQIRKTKRTLFGLELPDLNLFQGDGEQAEEVKSIEGVVASARMDEDSRWIMRLEDGATWQQIDGRVLGRRPRPGFKVEINRAALGSYVMRIEGQPGIKVRRVS